MPKFDETEFKQLLLNIDPNDVDKQADVYVYFRDHADMSKQPPSHLLVYAINNILYPNFLIEQSPDVLNLLGQVELLRHRAVNNCANILQLNSIYRDEVQKQNRMDFCLLSKEEEGRLTKFNTKSATDRKIFVDLVHWICLYHIRHLITLGNPKSVAKCMREYYGDDPETSLPKTIFYSGWDGAERKKVAESKEDAEALRSDVYDWEDDEGLPENTPYDDDTKEIFEEIFLLGVQPDKLFSLITLYLKRVKEIVDVLEKMFVTNKDR